jgi:Holliday junction resolvasome RuvABC endonuclease subunit
MKKKYVYALDLSLNSTGVCLFTNDGQFVKALTIDTHSEKETKLKLTIIGNEFLSLMKLYPPDTVIIEQGFSLFNASTQALFKVHGLVSYLFAEYEQIYYPATTVKKVVAGKGNMKKEEVRDIILKKYPMIQFSTLDESDAFSVGETYFIKKGIKDA